MWINLLVPQLDLNLHATTNADEPEEVPSSQLRQRVPSSLEYIIPSILPSCIDDRKPLSDTCVEGKAISSGESFFILPDLNMMPTEDDSGTETFRSRSQRVWENGGYFVENSNSDQGVVC